MREMMDQNNSSANRNIWLILIISIISFWLTICLVTDRYTTNKYNNINWWFEFLKRRGDDDINKKSEVIMKVFGPLGVIDYAYKAISNICSQHSSGQSINKEFDMLNKTIHEQKYELMKAYFTVGIFFNKKTYELAEKIAESTVKKVPKCDSLASIYNTFKPLKLNLEKNMEEQLQVVIKKHTFENLWKDARKQAGYD